MSSMKLRSLLGSILLGAGLMMAAATSSAAIFRGSWDPSFGSPYPDLGYRGFADFFVPDECLATDGWVSVLDCDASLLAATVELYDFSAGPDPIEDVAVFPVVPDPLLGVFIQSGQLMGVDTSIFGPQIGGPVITSAYSGNVWLEFVSGQMPPPILLLETVDTPAPTTGAFLHACLPDEGEASLCPEPEVRTTNPGVVTFQRIPEPGSLALIFGALGAGWIARRSIRKG